MIINHPYFGNKIPGIFEGKVVAHDPDIYMGVKIWVPGLHAEEYLKEENLKKLPTAKAAAPLFGNCDGTSGIFAYPEVGTIVYCFSIDGDSNSIVYFAADYDKSLKANMSYSALKIRYSEKDCAWMRQGPGQIVLRTPSTLLPAEGTENTGNDEDANLTRVKVVEIFSGDDVDSGKENTASISIFSNNDIEIKGANVTISASKSLNLSVSPDEEAVNTEFSGTSLTAAGNAAAESLNAIERTQLILAGGELTTKAHTLNTIAPNIKITAGMIDKSVFDEYSRDLYKYSTSLVAMLTTKYRQDAKLAKAAGIY